ncbi:MAG: UDP-galactopyranose mutase [Bacteroidetes bacterium GWA2_30_7]|nr:MAG: UDP-galactopyranose mutase [Bacteroidetes bacterium GWA2_30_7]
MAKVDFLIVGAGFSGAVFAEQAANKGYSVLVIEKNNFIGGACHDCYNSDNVLIHKFGAHIFHTNHENVWNYLSHFTQWNNYKHQVKANIGGKLYPFPININTLNSLYNLNLNEETIIQYFDKIRIKKDSVTNTEDQILSTFGEDLYNKFYKFYTKKQWGLWANELTLDLNSRIKERTNYNDNFFTDKYQGIPSKGYTELLRNILNHKNIKIQLETDFQSIKNQINYNYLIYTGRIDEYFNYQLGKLPFRSIKFEYETHNKEFYQPVAVVNYTQNLEIEYTRIVESKHMTLQKTPITTIIKEFPTSDGYPYYPIPQKANYELYTKYKKLSESLKNVIFLGRSAEYKYYNMDEVCFNSIDIFKKAPKNKKQN